MMEIFDSSQDPEYYENEFLVVNSNNEWKKKEKKSVDFYKQLIVPETMKSLYWEYFGFPADEEGNIISKEKVVCGICGNQISYCQNTTNLRSHLRNRHKAEYNNIQEKFVSKKTIVEQPKFISKVSTPPRLENYATIVTSPSTSQFKIKRKLESDDEKKFTFSMEEVIEPYQENTSSHTLEDNFEEVDDNQIEEVDEPPEKMLKNENRVVQISKNITIVPRSKATDTFSNSDEITSNILRMIFTDLVPLDIVDGSGFNSFVNSFLGDAYYAMPSKSTLNDSICKYYDKYKNDFYKYVKQSLQDYFSICFELWENCDRRSYITVSINTLDVSKFELNSFVIDVVEFNVPSEFEWDEFFRKHEYLGMLEKCFGCVMNFNDAYLKSYFVTRDIPILPCLASLLEKAMNTTLSLDGVSNIIEIIFSQYLTNKDQQNLESNWLSKWEKLVEIRDQLDQDTNRIDPEVLQNCALIVDFLKPIKVCLEVLSDLNCPSASLIKPMLEQLLEKHLAVDYEGELTSIMRQNINGIFAIEKTSLKFLNIASFLDPRFISSYDSDTTLDIKVYIRDYFNKKNENSQMAAKKSEPNSSKNDNKMKRLSFIFNKDSSKHNTSAPLLNSKLNSLSKIEAELEKYQQEESISTGDCPGKWWADNGFVYSNLKKLADQYFNISHSSHVRFLKNSLKEQINFTRKRHHMTDSIADKIVFLHYNKDIYEHFEAS